MKRNTRKVTKRTFTLQNALPTFVSIVSRGANYTPLAELRYSDDADKFSEVEINRIVFSKDKFTRESVESYLSENDYVDYTIEETDESFEVPGVDADKFEEVAPIEYGDGVMFFVGKLAIDTDGTQATGDVVETEILDYQEPEVAQVQEGAPEEALAEIESATEETLEDQAETQHAEEVYSESDDEDETDEDDKEEDEEDGAEPIEAVAASEPEQAEADEPETRVFNEKLYREKAEAALAAFMDALNVAKEEAYVSPVEEVELFTAEQVEEKIAEALSKASNQFSEEENKETDNKAIDETPIIVQNRHSIESEIHEPVSRNPENDEFSKRKSSDLFGLR